MGTVFLVAGLFISESTPYTVSAYPAVPAITRLHSGTQLYPGAGRKSDQLESRERGHAAVENSEDSAHHACSYGTHVSYKSRWAGPRTAYSKAGTSTLSLKFSRHSCVHRDTVPEVPSDV